MRLMEPYNTTFVTILKGPGTTRLFEAMVEKEEWGFSTPTGPVLEFTVEGSNGQPLSVQAEMIGTWKKVGGHYELDAAIGSNYVRICYWLNANEFGCRGKIEDLRVSPEET